MNSAYDIHYKHYQSCWSRKSTLTSRLLAISAKLSVLAVQLGTGKFLCTMWWIFMGAISDLLKFDPDLIL